MLFDPEHCDGARAHPSQAQFQYLLDDPWRFHSLWPHTYSALDGAELIAVGGKSVDDGVLSGWILFTDKITPARFLVIHRGIVRILVCNELSNKPIFLQPDPDNAQAIRWAGLLGLATRLTEVLPDGSQMLRVGGYVN